MKIKTRYTDHIFDALTEGLIVQDSEMKILLGNSAAAEVLGLSLPQLLGKDSYNPDWRTTKEDGSPFLASGFPSRDTIITGLPVRDVVVNVHTGAGIKKSICINTQPILDEDNAVSRVVSSFDDIS